MELEMVFYDHPHDHIGKIQCPMPLLILHIANTTISLRGHQTMTPHHRMSRSTCPTKFQHKWTWFFPINGWNRVSFLIPPLWMQPSPHWAPLVRKLPIPRQSICGDKSLITFWMCLLFILIHCGSQTWRDEHHNSPQERPIYLALEHPGWATNQVSIHPSQITSKQGNSPH